MYKKLILLVFFSAVMISTAQVKIVDQKSAEKVALNWISLIVTTHEKWDNASNPGIGEIEELISSDKLIGYYIKIVPTGSIIIPSINLLAPIYYYDTKFDHKLPIKKEDFDIVKYKLEQKFFLINKLVELNPDSLLDTEGAQKNIKLWDVLTKNVDEFEQFLSGQIRGQQVGPLLSSV